VEAVKPGPKPRFEQTDSVLGRAIGMGTCRNCHLLGVAGAPAVNDPRAWGPRIAKGKPAFYHSALNGARRADGAFRMPPRSGNPRLSDAEVRRGVDYMVASVKYLRVSAAPACGGAGEWRGGLRSAVASDPRGFSPAPGGRRAKFPRERVYGFARAIALREGASPLPPEMLDKT
jgi:cytochrome c5